MTVQTQIWQGQNDSQPQGSTNLHGVDQAQGKSRNKTSFTGRTSEQNIHGTRREQNIHRYHVSPEGRIPKINSLHGQRNTRQSWTK